MVNLKEGVCGTLWVEVAGKNLVYTINKLISVDDNFIIFLDKFNRKIILAKRFIISFEEKSFSNMRDSK